MIYLYYLCNRHTLFNILSWLSVTRTDPGIRLSVSKRLSCVDTWQISKWFKISNLNFSWIKFPVTEKLTNGTLVSPTPVCFERQWCLGHTLEHSDIVWQGFAAWWDHEILIMSNDILLHYAGILPPEIHCRQNVILMMTSSNRNIFRVTGPLCGEVTGHGRIPLTKASGAELWCFLCSKPE